MKQYQAVIFDLDGTLAEYFNGSVAGGSLYYRKVRLSRAFPQGGAGRFGKWAGAASAAVLPELTEPRFQALLGEFREYYVAHCNEATAPYPGILELLES